MDTLTLAERFWQKVDKRTDAECWEWQGSRNGDGYGNFWFGGRSGRAHRFSAMLAFGMFDQRLMVCHSCDNPACCNPRHLWLGDNSLNQRDSSAKGRHYLQRNPEAARESMARVRAALPERTHCKRGHAFTPDNTYIEPKGAKRCRTCVREAGKATYRRRMEKSHGA